MVRKALPLPVFGPPRGGLRHRRDGQYDDWQPPSGQARRL